MNPIGTKELSFCHKLKYFNLCIFVSNDLDLGYFKVRLFYLTVLALCCKDIRISKSGFVAKTHLLCKQ